MARRDPLADYRRRRDFTRTAEPSGEDAQEALKGLDDFSESYQASAAQPVPLFRRRAGR